MKASSSDVTTRSARLAAGNPTHENWAELGQFLQREDLLLVPQEQLLVLREQYRDLSQQEANLDDAILIGLVGGTGVGKSTFINALAGERVSRSSDRRPTTDRVVVYRHVNTEIPSEVPAVDFAQPEVLHDNGALEKVVLFDFPDFDSAEETHTHIIRRYLAHLDVLLVMVDDVKYADRRLYELLSTLDHDPQNIYVMMNKIDRLAGRYGDQTDRVIRELMEDFSQKLISNSSLPLAENQKYALAALAALEARERGEPVPEASRFHAIESMLAGYQEDKYRRAAKALNIEARKREIVDTLRQTSLGKENQTLLEETRQLVNGWRGALDQALQGIPVEILGESERRGLQGGRLRQVGPQWGLPFSLFFTLLGEVRKRSSKAIVAPELGQRVMHHYRGFFEAVKNVQARFESEFDNSKIQFNIHALPNAASSSSADFQNPQALGGPLRELVQQPTPAVPITAKSLGHLAPLAVMVLAIWGQIYGILDGETGILGALFDTMSPTFIVGTIVGVIFVYAFVSFLIWLREVQKLDHQIAVAEEATREVVRQDGQDAVDHLDANVKALYQEFEQLSALMGS